LSLKKHNLSYAVGHIHSYSTEKYPYSAETNTEVRTAWDYV